MAENFATVQVDLDGLWAMRRCYGHEDAAASDEDAVWSVGVPGFLELFAELGIRATFFVVGLDARVDWKAEWIRRIVEAGHEVANHSMTHHLDLALLGGDELDFEVQEAQKALYGVLGELPRGFKAPGYSISRGLLGVLDSRGFSYDASLFPSRWGWVMRGITAGLSRGEASRTQYGGIWDGELSLRPFVAGAERGLVELPVAVSRRLGLPFQSGVSMALGMWYFKGCLRGFAGSGLPLSYTLHGVDLTDLGAGDITGRGKGGFFFRRDLAARRIFVKECLHHIGEFYRFETCLSAADVVRSSSF